MRRPIASNEVAWLARTLVRASDAINAAAGLDRPAIEEEAAQGGPLEVRRLLHIPVLTLGHTYPDVIYVKLQCC